MPIDGVFIHFLIKEIAPLVSRARINRFISLNQTDFLLTLTGNKKLVISLDANSPHFRLTEDDGLPQPSSLQSFLKKHIEGGIITDLTQHHRDRLVIFTIDKTDELGYHHLIQMVVELMGRSSNLIFVDEEGLILECWKRSFITDSRVIQPHVAYQPITSNQNDPLLLDDIKEPLEGVSRHLRQELYHRNDVSFLRTIPIAPTLISWEGGSCFYAFDLISFPGTRTYFPSLSILIEQALKLQNTADQKMNDERRLDQTIDKELIKLRNKLFKQQDELSVAESNLGLEKLANVLSSNLHLVKKYQESLSVLNYYTGEEVTVPLDPHLSPSENVQAMFRKYKKAKRTIMILSDMIDETKQTILYFETMKQQAFHSDLSTLKQIFQELKPPKGPVKKTKPKILCFQDKAGNSYYVGKNNLQNNYLTHTLAQDTDVFFHVVGYPGSHVVFRGELTEDALKLASMLAASYSKVEGDVAVDYTLIKWVSKVKGQPGSLVTYTHQKQLHAKADETILASRLHQHS